MTVTKYSGAASFLSITEVSHLIVHMPAVIFLYFIVAPSLLNRIVLVIRIVVDIIIVLHCVLRICIIAALSKKTFDLSSPVVQFLGCSVFIHSQITHMCNTFVLKEKLYYITQCNNDDDAKFDIVPFNLNFVLLSRRAAPFSYFLHAPHTIQCFFLLL